MDLESVCAAFGCTNLAPKRTCPRCRPVMYRDAVCQKANWKVHKVVYREDFLNVEGGAA
ncbi:hypothetical protein M427DRAFT_62621 [Gonapodya prolifera JEL478]|uniref:MYND-type domain-containing protein n=1 Tax=Gonapodya prolifera (strain JEL478) TaxID=1344416 RepID=A0A139A096_GONPJ|nr:hypothetical protein M427DRAFT_62621 [Gonapodya prolifera JEL478]|eukprot:KXS10206.1 hypothetical protein M427DRAFT_62621 [Gonapodya prolifera JEL478]